MGSFLRTFRSFLHWFCTIFRLNSDFICSLSGHFYVTTRPFVVRFRNIYLLCVLIVFNLIIQLLQDFSQKIEKVFTVTDREERRWFYCNRTNSAEAWKLAASLRKTYAKEKLVLTFLWPQLLLENQSKIHHTTFGIRIFSEMEMCAINGSNFSWWIEDNLTRNRVKSNFWLIYQISELKTIDLIIRKDF